MPLLSTFSSASKRGVSNLYKSETWTRNNSFNGQFYHVETSGNGQVQLIAGTNMPIAISTNYAQTWSYTSLQKAFSFSQNPFAISSNGLIQVFCSDYIYISSDYGVTWNQRQSARSWVGAAASSDGSRITAIDAAGQIYTSSDFGVNWTARNSNRTWMSVSMSLDGSVQAALALDGVYRVYVSTDFGQTWTQRSLTIPAPVPNRVEIKISSDGSKQIIACGGIYASSDYGQTWSLIFDEGDRPCASCSISSDGLKILANFEPYGGSRTRPGTIYLSNNFGQSWTVSSPNIPSLSSCMSSDGLKKTSIGYNQYVWTCNV